MSSLDTYKTRLAKVIMCELRSIKDGDIKCANMINKFSREAQMRIFAIECLTNEPNGAETYRETINYLFEQVKEIITFISTTNCVQTSNCQ